MAKVQLVKGTTGYLARVFIQDTSKTDGSGLSGLTSGSSGLVCYRARDDDGNAGGTAISLSAGTRGTWSSGGFVEKDATNMKGVYELGVPNAALASGSKSALIVLAGATNMAPCVFEIELTGWDNQDGVHGGLSCLPNTAVTTNGSLLTAGTGTAQVNPSGGKVPATLAAADVSGNVPADLQTIKTQAVTASGGVTFPAATLASTTNITAGTITTTTNLTNLPSIPANWLTAAGIAAGAITSAKFAAGAIDASAIADAAIDRATFAADTGLQTLRSGTCQAGSTANTAVLDSGASATDHYYVPALLLITGGTGYGQGPRLILNYTGSTRTAAVSPSWDTSPDATTTFAVVALSGPADMETIAGQAFVNSVNGLANLGSAYFSNSYVAANLTKWLGGNPNALQAGRVDAYLDAAGATAALGNKLADHGRRRTQANVEASADGDALSLGSLYGAIQQMQESSVSGSTLTVKKTDNATTLGTKTLSTNAAAAPVVGVA